MTAAGRGKRGSAIWAWALLLACGASLPSGALAQCASCGNPAFVSSSNDLSQVTRGAGSDRLTLRTTVVYGYLTSDTYYKGKEDVGSLDNFRADISIVTLNPSIDLWFGGTLAMVLPWGRLASDRNFAPHTVDTGLGDIELRLRQDVLRPFGLAAGAPRVFVSLGLVAPTGIYVERTSTDDIGQFVEPTTGWDDGAGWEDINITPSSGDSSRFLSIGRGAWWALADVEAMGAFASNRLGWYGAVMARLPLSNAPDGFGWGNEVRTIAGMTGVLVPGRLSAGLTGEILLRGRSTEVLYGIREDFANGGGTFGYVTPSVQGELGWATASLSLRLPAYRDVVGEQVVDNMGVWLTIGGRWGFAPIAAVTAVAPKPTSTQIGDPPKQPAIAALLVPGKVTVVDYWASWCQPCQKLDVVMQQWVSTAPEGVVVKRFDASEWTKEDWLQYLPDAPTLPVLEIYDAQGRLSRRLSGDETFQFQEHVRSAASVAEARR